jgi:hypothetical protein
MIRVMKESFGDRIRVDLGNGCFGRRLQAAKNCGNMPTGRKRHMILTTSQET